MNKYWFVSFKPNTKCRADVKELTQLPDRQFKEERRHRHFDYLKYAVQKGDINPDFGSYKRKSNLYEIWMCLNQMNNVCWKHQHLISKQREQSSDTDPNRFLILCKYVFFLIIMWMSHNLMLLKLFIWKILIYVKASCKNNLLPYWKQGSYQNMLCMTTSLFGFRMHAGNICSCALIFHYSRSVVTSVTSV